MRLRAIIVFSFVLFLFVLGTIFPEQMWGIHALAFFPTWIQTMAFASGAVSIGFLFSKSGKSINLSNSTWILPLVTISVTAFVWKAPIVLDSFGDANALIEQLNIRVTDWSPRFLTELLRPNILNPKVGEETLYAFTALGSYLTGLSSLEFLFKAEIVCAMVFVLSVGSIVFRVIRSAVWRFSVMLACLSGSFMLVFQAHAEVYALSITSSMFYLAYSFPQFTHPTRWRAIAMFLLLPIVAKFHVLNWLLIPVTIYGASMLLDRSGRVRVFMHSNAILKLLIPIGALMTMVVYFLIQGGIEGTREYSEDDLYSSLLLPIIASEGPPYDRYGLLHTSHFLDFANLFLFWSPVALGIFLINPRGSLHNSLKSPALGIWIGSVATVMALFILNPLLSLPMDADLYSVPVPMFLCLVILSASALEKSNGMNKLPMAITIFSLITLSSSLSVANPSSLSKRYETLGKYVFKTHWMGSSTEIENAMKLVPNVEEQIHRRQEIIENLKPYAVSGIDMEYAEILRATGRLYNDSLKNPKVALQFFKEAYEMCPVLRKNVFDLVITYFTLGQYASAYSHVDMLKKMQYPNRRKSLRIAIHVSLAAQEYAAAEGYSTEYLQLLPEDRTVKNVLSLLRSNRKSEAIKLFRSS